MAYAQDADTNKRHHEQRRDNPVVAPNAVTNQSRYDKTNETQKHEDTKEK